jgi:hypothetical protein
MKLYTESTEGEWSTKGEVHLHIRFRPANLFGVLLMLLLHAWLIYLLLSYHVVKKQGEVDAAQNEIVLVLNKVASAKKSKPETKKSEPKSKPRPKAKENKAIAPVLIAEQPNSLPPPPPETKEAPEMDMSAMLNAARERRRNTEQSAAQENQAAQQGSRGMSAQEVAEANVKRSMRQASGRDGTNGVFQIISKSTRTGSFSFRGWTPGGDRSWRQVIEVDAGLGGNVELAIVRRMIELIRTHYTGDFNWESQRLGRVINLSARPKDSAELENFMMKEFFGNVS